MGQFPCRDGLGELTFAHEGLKTSLVVPAFEMVSKWKMSPGQDKEIRDDMRRGNRPVAFYCDQVQLGTQLDAAQPSLEKRSKTWGLFRTNRLFYYSTAQGKAKLQIMCAHMAHACAEHNAVTHCTCLHGLLEHCMPLLQRWVKALYN